MGEAQQGVGGIYIYQIYTYISAITIHTHTHTHTHTHMYGLCCCTTEINCPAGLPRWLRGERIHLQCRRHKRRGFDPSIRKIPWRRSWQSTQVFLPGESLGERSQTSYSLWGHKESDKTEQLNAHSRNQRNIVKQLSWNLRERESQLF